ncbi:hypothetical protein OQA88_10440 [Cercophora sp. LCS_1]
MAEPEQSTAPVQGPVRILSLDGGGIRGLSSLMILEEIMKGIGKEMGLPDVPKPCDIFNMIGGTSTGGIISIMLGRLGMTVEECLEAYQEVARQAFTRKRRLQFLPSSSGSFSATALENAIKKVVKQYCTEPNCVDERDKGNNTCPHDDLQFGKDGCVKTAVLAITRDDVGSGPTLFTTYDPKCKFYTCAIWQIARATSAAPAFFKPIRLGSHEIEFIDAAIGYNNPCEVIIKEARNQFPNRRLQILSVGTGLKDPIPVDGIGTLLHGLVKMATSTDEVHVRVRDQAYHDSELEYFRFDVDRGLEDIKMSDWRASNRIVTHTGNYLRRHRREIQEYVNNFPSPTSQAVSKKPDTLASTSHFCVPLAKNESFVGRKATVDTLAEMIFSQRNRRVALYGLGGMGKTQIALHLAYEAHKERDESHPRYSVFWVSALSDASFEQSYAAIAKELRIVKGDGEDIKEVVRQNLSSLEGPWLLIVDNADDTDLVLGGARFEVASSKRITHYLPESENGFILFTTRSEEVATSVARDKVVELEKMSEEEASRFLEQGLRGHDIHRDEADTKKLLEALCYLPLAMAQTVAYLKKNKRSISEYLALLLGGTEEDITHLMTREFYDETRYEESKNAVASTWLVSFNQIRKHDPFAADLLAFISCIEPKAIPRSILPECGSEAKMLDALGTLCAYAFLTRQGESETYVMHSLVHLATQIWVRERGLLGEKAQNAIRHVSDVFPNDDWKNRDLWREYMPHALKVLKIKEGEDMEQRCELFQKSS